MQPLNALNEDNYEAKADNNNIDELSEHTSRGLLTRHLHRQPFEHDNGRTEGHENLSVILGGENEYDSLGIAVGDFIDLQA